MSMVKHPLFIIASICWVILAFTFGLIIIQNVLAEQYQYNLTKNETDQIIISELCYAKIDLGECKFMYGGIDTPYGEPIK